MCNRQPLFDNTPIQAIGEFQKGNEPSSIRMPVIAMHCKCGLWMVRHPDGIRWVEAEKIA